MTRRLKPLINVGLSVSAGCQDASTPTPLVEITGPEEAVFVAHEVADQKYLTIPLTLKNHGRKPIHVEVSKKSCNCLSVDLPEAAIPASTDANIQIQIDSLRGVTRKSVSLELAASSDTKSVNVPYSQTVRVLSYRAEPSIIDCRLLTTTDVVRIPMKLTVFSTDRDLLEHANPACARLPDEFSIENVSDLGMTEFKPGVFQRNFELVFAGRYSQRAPAGIYARCSIGFGNTKLPTIPLPISLRLTTGVSINPTAHRFEPPKLTKPENQIFRRGVLRALDGKAFRILKCESTSVLWTLTADSAEEAALHVVTIYLNGDRVANVNAPVEASATIATTHSEARAIQLRLSWAGVDANRTDLKQMPAEADRGPATNPTTLTAKE